MSDLVEKVARAIQDEVDTVVGHKDGPLGWKYQTREAHAAIAAVAEWLAQSEGRECNPLQALATALRAAAASTEEK